MQRLPTRRGWSCWLGALCFTLAVVHCKPAHAYAWMIKHGFAKCGACHTDPSGGETLTGMGRAEAEQLLSMGGGADPEQPGIEPVSQFLFGAVREPRDLRLGASYRHLFVYSTKEGETPSDFSQFPMQLDAYGSGSFEWFVVGGSLGVAKGITGTAHVRGAQLNRELEEGWILLSRNHFVGVRVDEWTLLRFGRLNLPYGIRIPEHVAWVREATRTDRESDQQHGVALSHAKGRLRLEAMAILGNFQTYPDRYRERGYSLSLEYLLGNTAALGLSSLLTRANEDRFTQAVQAVRYANGLNGRIGFSRTVALWGEADILKEGGRDLGYAGLLQTDVEPWRGLHFMLTGEVLDQGELQSGGKSSPGVGEPRFGVWASVLGYLYSHFELRLDVMKRQESPLTLQAQLHVFL